jgi:hypothetical protein
MSEMSQGAYRDSVIVFLANALCLGFALFKSVFVFEFGTHGVDVRLCAFYSGESGDEGIS